MTARFALAKMGTGFMVGTGFIIAAPIGGLLLAMSVPHPFRLSLFLFAGIVATVGVGVRLLMRPSFFELSEDALRICWPLRSRMISRRSIQSARLLSESELTSEFGQGVRIGAGGAWGKFGLYRTPKTTFSLWASRSDAMVVVELANERPLLITPSHPETFVAELSKHANAASLPGH